MPTDERAIYWGKLAAPLRLICPSLWARAWSRWSRGLDIYPTAKWKSCDCYEEASEELADAVNYLCIWYCQGPSIWRQLFIYLYSVLVAMTYGLLGLALKRPTAES